MGYIHIGSAHRDIGGDAYQGIVGVGRCERGRCLRRELIQLAGGDAPVHADRHFLGDKYLREWGPW